MAFGLNRAELIGRLGADATVRSLEGDRRVANLSIATDESYYDKKAEKVVKRTEWHRVHTFHGPLVTRLEKHAKKGRLVFVSGRLRTRSYEVDGVTRYDTGILLDPYASVEFLDKPPASAAAPAPSSGGGASDPSGEAATEQPPDLPSDPPPAAPSAASFDDDIPF